MTPSPEHRHSLLTESWIFAGRLFIQWRRYPMVPLQALLFPTGLLVIYGLLVGKSMVRITGNSGLDLLYILGGRRIHEDASHGERFKRGIGIGIMIQGALLFVWDLILLRILDHDVPEHHD